MPIIIGFLSERFKTDQIIAGIGFSMILPLIFNIALKFPVPKQEQSIAFKQFFRLAGNKLLMMFGFVLFFQSGLEALTNNWTTSYLIEVIKVDEQQALFSLTLYVGIFTVTRFILGFILKILSSEKVLITSVLLVLLGGCIIILAGNLGIYIAGLICIALGLSGGFPVVLGLVGDRFPSWSGTAFGVVFSIALIGNIIINYLNGVAAELWTITIFPVVFIVAGLFMAILLFFTLKRSK
jgi:fucose permease